MAKENNEVTYYRFAEMANGQTIVGKWVVYKDKNTLRDRAFWDFQVINRTSPGEGYDHRNRRVQFREEIPSEQELTEVFAVAEVVQSAPKIEVPWLDCLKAQALWKELMEMGVAQDVAIKKMCEKFPLHGPTASKYAGFNPAK